MYICSWIVSIFHLLYPDLDKSGIYCVFLLTVPTVPANLKAKAINPEELHITWDPPNSPNGNVTHYEVYWRRRKFDPRSFAPRDYCTNRE